ncbi:hypothetical protein GGR57DRAFT_510314 [Xylariaceae sp. FL1272]|nr:hypothetical protein GGR57DRAFT_510314 [Xylariaceae sp. FL1272]
MASFTAITNPGRRKRRNTKHEWEKGRNLMPESDDDAAKAACLGTPATTGEGYCHQAKDHVWVAKDPIAFGSFKCSNCIMKKKGNCTFSAANPGIEYAPEIIKQGLEIERKKGRAKEKRQQTNERRGSHPREHPHQSNSPSLSLSAHYEGRLSDGMSGQS